MKRRLIIYMGVIFFLWAILICYAQPVYLKQFTFSKDNALNEWQKMILNGEVAYLLRRFGRHDYYVRAFSDKACSALYYKIRYQSQKYPFISWKWRVEQFPDISKARNKKEKDDFAARLYVIFISWNFSSSKFLEYVWAEDLPKDSIMDSPFGKNVKLIVARSGRAEEGMWINEVRNVYQDYIDAFGQEPQRKIGAIAIMCDADGTNSQAEALFDDILIAKSIESSSFEDEWK